MTDLNVPAGAPDPAEDPEGYVADLLRQYVSAAVVVSLIRTVVPIGIGAVLAWVATNYNVVVPERASSTVVVLTTAAITAGYYALARLVEKRFPRLGRWLVALNLVKARPVYVQPAVAGVVEGRHRAPETAY